MLDVEIYTKHISKFLYLLYLHESSSHQNMSSQASLKMSSSDIYETQLTMKLGFGRSIGC